MNYEFMKVRFEYHRDLSDPVVALIDPKVNKTGHVIRHLGDKGIAVIKEFVRDGWEPFKEIKTEQEKVTFVEVHYQRKMRKFGFQLPTANNSLESIGE